MKELDIVLKELLLVGILLWSHPKSIAAVSLQGLLTILEFHSQRGQIDPTLLEAFKCQESPLWHYRCIFSLHKLAATSDQLLSQTSPATTGLWLGVFPCRLPPQHLIQWCGFKKYKCHKFNLGWTIPLRGSRFAGSSVFHVECRGGGGRGGEVGVEGGGSQPAALDFTGN